jgi:hypothetical protein
MNERKLIDEIKRLVNNDVIIGYYNGTTFTDDNGKTYASSYLVTNNSPIGRGFIVPYEGKWLVVVANNNQEVRKNIITSRRKISIEDKSKPLIDYLLTETLITTKIRFIFDASGSLDYFREDYNIIFANIKETLTVIYEDTIDTYVTNIYLNNERWLNWMIPTSDNEIVIAFINESNSIYHFNSYLESAEFNADRGNFETAYNRNLDRKFKGFVYAIEPLANFDNHITFVFEKYNLANYNLSYKFVDSGISAGAVEQDFLKFITPNIFYTIRDNKWKKYELPETVVLKNLNYYIDSNYVVIKGDEKDERFNQLTVLKDDVFTTYTYPEELPVLKTWRKDIYNTYNVINNTYSNKLVTMQQNRLYEITKKLNDIIDLNLIIEALSLEQSINLDIAKCRFNEDEITSCRKEPFKVKSPKLDTNIISPEEVNKQTIVSTYIKFQ